MVQSYGLGPFFEGVLKPRKDFPLVGTVVGLSPLVGSALRTK